MSFLVKNFIVIKIIVILSILGYIDAVCETQCSRDAAHICTGERTFQACVRGAAVVTTTFKCPDQYSCVNTRFRCERNAVPVCQSQCGLCNPTTNVACMSRSVYAFCFNDKPFYGMNSTCPVGTPICNSESEETCISLTARDKPSCDSDRPVFPTDSTPSGSPEDVMNLCRRMNRGGKFSVGGDRTCKRYNYCYLSRGMVMGKQYQCPGQTVFNCQTQQCGLGVCNNQCQQNGMMDPNNPYPNNQYPNNQYPNNQFSNPNLPRNK